MVEKAKQPFVIRSRLGILIIRQPRQGILQRIDVRTAALDQGQGDQIQVFDRRLMNTW